MEVSFPTDSDGFLSQECPSCTQRFKVLFGQGAEEPISFCPYCGYNDLGCWSTQEQNAHMKAVALDVVVAPEFRKLERELTRASGGLISARLNTDSIQHSHPPMETDAPLEIFQFPCCQETVKLIEQQNHFCIICGTEFDMTISEAKRVFLSHKGVDKEMVIDFKDALELLGYEPWLDDDAMPAGTPLERGLLQGMKDSCCVVFFVTPQFKDEGYLETEINYAMSEKHRKRDKFAIVTLLFVGDDERVAEIPDLLGTLVYKKPKTQLEALREIIRALPVTPGVVDWRDEATGVVKRSKATSTTANLTQEAVVLLKEAVIGDGRIGHMRGADLETISVNGKSMIQDGSNRTIAMWRGGLEDLVRFGFIRDVGHRGQIYEVTREGYEMADGLRLDQPNVSG